MLVYYTLSLLICLAIYVWTFWYLGEDVRVQDIMIMTLVAALPIANILIAIAAIICAASSKTKVILKGRR